MSAERDKSSFHQKPAPYLMDQTCADRAGKSSWRWPARECRVSRMLLLQADLLTESLHSRIVANQGQFRPC